MAKRDEKRHKYAIMIDAHRQEWVKFCKAQFDKPYKADRTAIKKIFAATSAPDEAAKRIKSYFKKDAALGWKTALKTAWVETGKASITYMHEFLTAKSAYEPEPEILCVFPDGSPQMWRDVLKQEVDALHQSWEAFVDRYLTTAGDKIKDITDTTQDRIMDIIKKGVEQGKGHYEIGQEIDANLDETWPGRGMTISRTEANSAMNYATLHDAKATVPDLWKTWSTTGMDNVREWHQDADGQMVPMDSTFTVMDEDLDCPGDDSGSPENIINCACCMLFEPAPEESGVPGEESSEEE